MATTQNARDVPQWEAVEVSITTTAGALPVRALVHPWCPGLAVTMLEFGTFRVTHVTTGMVIGGRYERVSGACCELAEWAAIGRTIGLAWQEADGAAARTAFVAAQATPVPFGGTNVTGGGESRPMTVGEWVTFTRTTQAGDEFPWESWEESPTGRADAILHTLAPSEEAR